jgi:TolB protein
LNVATSGTLEVITATTDPPAGLEAYSLVVDDIAHAIGPADTLSLPDLSAADHEVGLTELPAGCGVEGDNPRVISLAPSATSRLTFPVSCQTQLPPGDLHVAIATFGSGSDPDGYSLLVDEAAGQPVAATGDITVPGLAAGPHLVRLAGVDPTCEVRSANPRTVLVPQTEEVRFEVTCVPPLSGVIAYVSNRSNPDSVFAVMDIFLRSADGATLQNVTNTPGVDERQPAWSPDGARIAFIPFQSDSVFVMDADGGNRERLVAGVQFPNDLVWSPDGSRLLFLDETPGFLTELSAYEFATQQRRVLATQPPEAGLISAFCLSRDGSRVAYSVTDFVPDPFTSSIFTVATAGGSPTLVTSGTGVQLEVQAWSPDGTTLAYTRRRSDQRSDIFLVQVDGSNPVNLTNQPGQYRDVRWSPDGGLLAFRASFTADFFGGFSFELFTITPTGSLRQLTHEPSSYGELQWSPDGSRLLFEDGLEIFVMNFDGTGLRALTHDGLLNDEPRWRP